MRRGRFVEGDCVDTLDIKSEHRGLEDEEADGGR